MDKTTRVEKYRGRDTRRVLERERRQPRLSDRMSERGCRRGGSRGCRARSICENEICAFDLRAGAAGSIAGCGYEKVKLIQFGCCSRRGSSTQPNDLILLRIA